MSLKCIDPNKYKKSIIFIVLLLISLGLLSACQHNYFFDSEKSNSYSMSFFAMNTHMHIEAIGIDAERAVYAAVEEVYRLEALLSRTAPQSELFALNNAEDPTFVHLSTETLEVLSDALYFAQLTSGHFDPTIAPLMDLWGFTDGHYTVPSSSDILSALEYVGYEKVSIDVNASRALFDHQEIRLDLGGIAKGYASDRVAEILMTFDIDTASVNLGGNVFVYGKKIDGNPYRVGIADPIDKNAYAGILNVYDMSIITSGGYERYFEYNGVKYIHIMDPHTGQPVQSDLISVTIVDPSGVKGDALSTALYVMGLDDAIRFWQNHGDFGCVLIDYDYNIYVSENLRDLFSTDESMTVYYIDRGDGQHYGST